MKLLHKENRLKRLNKQGQAMIEFLFILPILFIFFYIGIEFSHLLIQGQRVNALSREVAKTVFHDCAGLNDDMSKGNNDEPLTNCVQPLVNKIAAEADGILSNFSGLGTIKASVYAADLNAGSNPPPLIFLKSFVAGSGGYATNPFNLSTQQNTSDESFVAVGEVFYPYQPLTPVIQWLTYWMGPVNPLPEVLYEYAVF